ncbi:MAG: hypothetical protein WBV74_12790 [Pseudonocardiaceae bacterium]
MTGYFKSFDRAASYRDYDRRSDRHRRSRGDRRRRSRSRRCD